MLGIEKSKKHPSTIAAARRLIKIKTLKEFIQQASLHQQLHFLHKYLNINIDSLISAQVYNIENNKLDEALSWCAAQKNINLFD